MNRIPYRSRLIFYGLFAIYQISAFVFTIMVDGHLDLLALLKYIPKFKWVAFIGLAFLLVDVIWFLIERRNRKSREEDLDHENNLLKAKIYDFQEAAKASEPSKKP